MSSLVWWVVIGLALTTAIALLVTAKRWHTRWLTAASVALAAVLLVVALGMAFDPPPPTPSGRAAPLASNIHIYVSGAFGSQNTLAAISARTGTTVWRHTFPGADFVGAEASDAHAVYVLAGKDAGTPTAEHIVALRPSDGGVLWDLPLDAYGAAGLFVADRDAGALYVNASTPAGEQILALDMSTGSVRWTFKLPSDLLPDSRMGPIHPAGNRVYVPVTTYNAPDSNGAGEYSEPSQIVALDAATGSVAWRAQVGNVGTGGMAIVPDSGAGVVYIPRANGPTTSPGFNGPYTLLALRASDGATLWQAPESSDAYAPILLSSGLLYARHDDGVIALDASTGKVRWRFPEDAHPPSGVQLSPIAVGQVAVRQATLYLCTAVYAGKETATNPHVVVALDATSGAFRWATQGQCDGDADGWATDSAVFSSVYSTDPKLAVNLPTLIAQDPASGAARWRLNQAQPSLFPTSAPLDPSVTLVRETKPASCFFRCPQTQLYLTTLDTASGSRYWSVPIQPPQFVGRGLFH
jgi:outer membrane protein assembly factor BamB